MSENSSGYETVGDVEAVELLLHPVRLRIVQAVFDGRSFTTAQLQRRLPDVSRPTLYRQVAVLVGEGVLELVGEQKVRAVLERHYQLRHARAVVDDAAAQAMTVDDHRVGFGAAVASLLAEFDGYLQRPDARPHHDAVSYRQFPLWLDEVEKAALVAELVAVVRPRLEQSPGQGRRRHLLSTILFPAEPGEEAPAAAQELEQP
jgi:DNA-binding transcriptional ArsR family regulator